MNTVSISNLATPAGRSAYQEYWHDLVIEQRRAVLPSLWQLWRTAAFGSEMRVTAIDTSYRPSHPLGPRVGTRVFMEEIIVRHYYNNVQALVYFGAVILLVFLGLRFAGLLSENISLIGIAIEAMMLLVLFMVLFYSPEDDQFAPPIAGTSTTEARAEQDAEDRGVIKEVLEEIEEIGSSYAALALKLEQAARGQEESLRELSVKIGAIQGLNLLESHAERLETTNTLLAQLTGAIESMNQRVDMLFGKELEFYVRRELERMVGRDANGALGNPDAARDASAMPGETNR
jgi:hypothetical protein